MRALRTPDESFAGLPGYGFDPSYAQVDDLDGGTLRVHYLDEGPTNGVATGETVLLMHGEPSWSFLYRKMIPVLTAAGIRVIAPDLVGFGRSDKPTERSDYTYARHVEWMRSVLFDQLNLSGLTLVGQDWGGLVGLRLAGENPDRFRRLVAANTGLPTGDAQLSDAFFAWQRFSQETANFHVGGIVKGGCRTELSPEVIAAYDAPFPDDSYKAGARMFPLLVPSSPDDPAVPANLRAWDVLSAWEKPFLTAFSDSDPITAGGERIFRAKVPGAKGQPNVTIEGGGHFLQEDRGEELAGVV
ncbi:MAG: haloalkane dehalogenase, partial [Acidimicrobiales bacterium]